MDVSYSSDYNSNILSIKIRSKTVFVYLEPTSIIWLEWFQEHPHPMTKAFVPRLAARGIKERLQLTYTSEPDQPRIFKEEILHIR